LSVLIFEPCFLRKKKLSAYLIRELIGFTQKLKEYKLRSIQELEQVIILFYDKHNNKRLHSSICNLPSNIFIECRDKKLIEMNRDEMKRDETSMIQLTQTLMKIHHASFI
jgi:hypothetical protein